MPFLPQALESVASQTYDHFELVIQEGCSTDGSRELLEAFRGAPQVSLESSSDGGIGPAYNRAVQRARGELIASIDSDNLLAPEALELGVAACRQWPDAAAVYGSAHLIGPGGERVSTFVPEEFELVRLLCCELVPPFATSFFRPAACGGQMRFDPGLKTCADFDLWLRLSDRPIRRIDSVLGSTRLSQSSMTCRPETYDQFCQDKLAALRRYFGRFASCPPLVALSQRASAGVFLWAAESVLGIEGPSDRFRLYCQEAARLDPGSPRLRNLRVAALSHSPSAPPDEVRTPVSRPRFSLARAKNALRGLTRSL
jgi:hypothetical protein